MKLTLQEVEHIAALARLRLTDEEKAAYREQLSAVLEYVARLQTLDTGGIPPTSSVQPPQTRLRPDAVEAMLPREQLFANAPEVQNGQFRVPPVLED